MENSVKAKAFAAVLLLAGAASAVTVDFEAGNDGAIGFAARDLQRILKDVPGTVTLKVDPALPAQTWRFTSRADGSLEIAGRDGMGISYGVSTFLEKYAGVAWLAPDTEIVPDLKGWKIPTVDETGRPAFTAREMYVGDDWMDATWRLRNKETKRAAHGVGSPEGSPQDCHTFALYAKPLREAHPELFKTRKTPRGQNCTDLCMCDETTRDFVAEEMCRYIAKDRETRKGKPLYTVPTLYDLSQNDGPTGFECYCEKCKAMSAAAGSYAGPNLAFASAVAERVAKRYPDVMVQTFAYAYTHEPPTNDVRAADNVLVRFVSSALFSPLLPGNRNGDFLEKWSRHCSHFSLWSYWRTYDGIVYPVVKPRRDIRDELRYCRKLGVERYFAEDEAPLSRSFAMHQHWLFLKMTEDPSQDVFALSKRFFVGYYGAAARPMAEYLRYLESVQEKTFAYLNREFFEKANAWIDEAEKLVAGDEKLLRHVRWERVPLDRAMFDRLGELMKQGYRFDAKKSAARYAAIRKDQYENWEGFRWTPGPRKERLQDAAYEADLYAHYPIPIPDQFKGRQVETVEWFKLAPICKKGEFVADPDAAAGMAFWIPSAEMSLPYGFGYYSDRYSRGGGKGYKSVDEVPQDEKFHWVHLCREIIQQQQKIYFDKTWRNCVFLPTLGIVPSEWDVWLSVKFQGPAFVTGSTKPNRVLFDRAIFVK